MAVLVVMVVLTPIVKAIVTVTLMPKHVSPFKKENVNVDQIADSVMVIQALEEELFQIIVIIVQEVVEMVFASLFNVANVKEVTVANSHISQKVVEDHTAIVEINSVSLSNVVNAKEAIVANFPMKRGNQPLMNSVVHTIKY